MMHKMFTKELQKVHGKGLLRRLREQNASKPHQDRAAVFLWDYLR